MRPGARAAWAAALVTLSVPVLAAPPPDAAAIAARAREVQAEDFQAWARHSFKREVSREKRDGDGKLKESERLVFTVTPRGDEFDEVLVTRDGRPASPAEIREHQRRARFTKHYRMLTGGEEQEDTEGRVGGTSLRNLLRMPAYDHVGVEEVDGVPCHRLRFAPAPTGQDDLAGRLAAVTRGELWLTVDGPHLARAEARTERAVSVALGFAKVRSMHVTFQATPVSATTWLPTRIDVVVEGRVLAGGPGMPGPYLRQAGWWKRRTASIVSASAARLSSR